ncbi:hypothetical protein F5884DRAFT_732455 [Xylogone sp. PMI_703]|nr:hypothetical protein F5884DRAFT_732455 [Xylogone sp. PMI_703]
MAKKKNKSPGESPNTKVSTDPPILKSRHDESKPPHLSTSSLIICRNKHWRYISSFHGPWLQLPADVLESLANNNYYLPRPRPIDPAVFFDLLKIRKLVDDATNLAVRATNGITSSSLTNSLNAINRLFPNSGTALGLGLGGNGGNAKLSRERKHRMREQATQKLSKAYHLDEIACSVATMQSASSLEDVAQLVLQRSPLNADAKYVHFFHEKIPSRQLAECTSLQPLNQVIAERSSEAEVLRTRAVTRMFKDDFLGAAQDLTTALQICRYYQNQHETSGQQLQLARDITTDPQRSNRWRQETKLQEEDHPSSLETQLLFHRAGVYLTIAFQHVRQALPTQQYRSNSMRGEMINGNSASTTEVYTLSEAETKAQRQRLEARKTVKTYAKRALRDYISFLSLFDYTAGLPSEFTQEYMHKAHQAANNYNIPKFREITPQTSRQILNHSTHSSPSNDKLSGALIPHNWRHTNHNRQQEHFEHIDSTRPPKATIYQISSLFSATPLTDLPPYPVVSNVATAKQQTEPSQHEASKELFTNADSNEAITYHPLLTDALHSLLLCHCLIQTSARELQRHAYMVARLARICDGYPIFQAPRSPSRADWIEVLRRTDNWIQLQHSWETLCAPAPLPGQGSSSQQKETTAERKERLRQQAIMEALEDDRVHDEASFHAAVAARQRIQEEEARKAEGREIPKRWAQEDGKEYPISTERAEAIVQWIKEAPISDDPGSKKKKRSSKHTARKKTERSFEGSMLSLKLEDNAGSSGMIREEADW